jgi:hypothetical protein
MSAPLAAGRTDGGEGECGQLTSRLPAAEVELDAAVLDRIDEIVRPGVDLNPADTSDGERALQRALRRR